MVKRRSGKAWNSLPPAVLNCDSLSTFKSRLNIHLFLTELLPYTDILVFNM